MLVYHQMLGKCCQMKKPLESVLVGIATVGPCGLVPVAPGTVGSIAGLALVGLVRLSDSVLLEVSVLVALVGVGVVAASAAESAFQRRDPGQVVIDEVAGMFVTVLFMPIGWGAAVTAFFLFRLCDIVKPFPARHAEFLPNGWGVMADDIVAGLYAQGLLRALLWATGSG